MSIDFNKFISKNRSVFLIIDMQNDFIAEGAPLECKGGRRLIPRISQFKAWCRDNGVPVVYTQEAHRLDRVDSGIESILEAPEHCIEGTSGVDIIEALAPELGDYIIVKRRFSAFYQTDLEILLNGLGRDCLILAGVSTNVCVYAAALDAHSRDMRVVVLSDCCLGTSEDLHVAFLNNMKKVIGSVTDSETLMKELI